MIGALNSELCCGSRILSLVLHRLMSRTPSNFSWVSENVAGFAFPDSKENLDFLVNQAHISRLITLNEDKPSGLESFPSNLNITVL